MTTKNLINDCAKCIDMCKKEYSSEFTDWIEKLMLTEIAGDSDTKNDVDNKKDETKELSIKLIKEELMDAFLGDMRIINSFENKDVKKVTDYIGKNIFSNLCFPNIMTNLDIFINFDVTKSNNGYRVFIITGAHKDLLEKDIVNRLDLLSEYIEEIVNELYPYNCHYTDIPYTYTTDLIVNRQIEFMLKPDYKESYEEMIERETTA